MNIFRKWDLCYNKLINFVDLKLYFLHKINDTVRETGSKVEIEYLLEEISKPSLITSLRVNTLAISVEKAIELLKETLKEV